MERLNHALHTAPVLFFYIKYLKMRTHIFSAIKLTVITLFFFGVMYPLFVWGLAQVAPNGGLGKTIDSKGTKQYVHIGQVFTEEGYFWSRPSAVDYNAAGSGGSNKGPSNPAYLKEVAQRIAEFMEANPTVARKDVPVEMVTASASGLDPDISVAAARVQVARVAKARGVSMESLQQLIDAQSSSALLGLLGPDKVNVLQLNIALANLSK